MRRTGPRSDPGACTATDISYILMARGFVYLIAIIDVSSTRLRGSLFDADRGSRFNAYLHPDEQMAKG